MKAKIVFRMNWIVQGSGLNSFSVKKTIQYCRDAFPGTEVLGRPTMDEAELEIPTELDAETVRRKIEAIIREKIVDQQGDPDVFTLTIEDDGREQGAPAAPEGGPESGSAASGGVVAALQRLLGSAGTTPAAPAADPDEAPAPTQTPKAASAPVGGGAKVAEEAEPWEKNADETAAVLGEVDRLVGADEFKELCRNIAVRAPIIRKNRTQEIFLSEVYAFAVPTGYGFSSSLSLLSQLLCAAGIWQEKLPPKELTLPSPEDPEVSSRLTHFLDASETLLEKTCVVAIDISGWVGRTASVEFKRVLLKLSDSLGKTLVVFRLPGLNEKQLEQTVRDIGDVLSVRQVRFPVFTAPQRRELAGRLAGKTGFELDDSAFPVFDKRMEQEAQDGFFYGVHTIKKVVNEMIRVTEMHSVSTGQPSERITADSLRGLVPAEAEEEQESLAKLDALIGIEPIKQQIMEIVNQILITRKNPGLSKPCMHIRFVGNPGTGKTTVARILGEIFKSYGILRVGRFFEHKARDLCGRYVGETAPKTTRICEEAYGSILFLDEAYALFRGDRSSNDYGREAIDTLVAEMENHSDDFVVIMAGYPEDMDTMFESNPGLKSRMPYTLYFPDYTREQLWEIFMKLVKDSFAYDSSLEERSRAYFDTLPDAVLNRKNFGNARFVRNLFERTWGKAGMRCNSQNAPIVLTAGDFDEAVKALGVEDAVVPEKKIGFQP